MACAALVVACLQAAGCKTREGTPADPRDAAPTLATTRRAARVVVRCEPSRREPPAPRVLRRVAEHPGADEVRIKGAHTAADIRAAVDGAMPRLVRCAERESPTAAVAMALSFRIADTGRVTAAQVRGAAEGFTLCARAAVSQMRFPRGRGIASVRYPLRIAGPGGGMDAGPTIAQRGQETAAARRGRVAVAAHQLTLLLEESGAGLRACFDRHSRGEERTSAAVAIGIRVTADGRLAVLPPAGGTVGCVRKLLSTLRSSAPPGGIDTRLRCAFSPRWD